VSFQWVIGVKRRKIFFRPLLARRARAVTPALSVEPQNRSARRPLNHPDLAVCGLVRRLIHEVGRIAWIWKISKEMAPDAVSGPIWFSHFRRLVGRRRSSNPGCHLANIGGLVLVLEENIPRTHFVFVHAPLSLHYV
jgi:hypothetical protein